MQGRGVFRDLTMAKTYDDATSKSILNGFWTMLGSTKEGWQKYEMAKFAPSFTAYAIYVHINLRYKNVHEVCNFCTVDHLGDVGIDRYK